MILKINLVDSKIISILADLFVTIEQVRFFPDTVIYKKKFAHPPRGRDPFHHQQVYLLFQPIGDTPGILSQ